MADQERSGESTVTRRGFFGWALGLGAGIVALVAGVPQVWALLAATRSTVPNQFVDVGKVDDLPAGEPTGLTFVAESSDAYNVSQLPHNVWAVKDASDTVTVFSPVCTHLGCQVAWNADAQRFVCPCHNSIFTTDGKVVSGPAPRPLDTLPTKVKDGTLSVQWVDFTPGLMTKTPV
jgi:menaquinol-cytochrome c reductase iron-sulfur subunit